MTTADHADAGDTATGGAAATIEPMAGTTGGDESKSKVDPLETARGGLFYCNGVPCQMRL